MPTHQNTLIIRRESWPLAAAFTIARGSKTEAAVLVAEIHTPSGLTGRGECVPYKRYGETLESVAAAMETVRAPLEAGNLTREALQQALPHGAARNALDCALWDIALKTGTASLPNPAPSITAYTLSLDTPEAMGKAAAANSHRPLLKIKLGHEGDAERLHAIRTNAPQSRLIIDANEGWTPQSIEANLAMAAAHGVSLIEQPLPAHADECLSGLKSPIPLCADESLHTRADLPNIRSKYQAINIKLDKAGGLTEALALKAEAKRMGLRIMVGCMVGTSLAMAPACYLTHGAEWVDLDGPLLLAHDRPHALTYEGSILHAPQRPLWG